MHSFDQECIFIETKSRCVLDINQIFKDFLNTDAVRIDLNSETTYHDINTVETVKDTYSVFEDSQILQKITSYPHSMYWNRCIIVFGNRREAKGKAKKIGKTEISFAKPEFMWFTRFFPKLLVNISLNFSWWLLLGLRFLWEHLNKNGVSSR